MPISALSAETLEAIRTFLNGIDGRQGITVEIVKGAPIIKMGDSTFILQTFWSAAPTFVAGELASITFQQMAGFVQTVGSSTVVEAEECATV